MNFNQTESGAIESQVTSELILLSPMLCNIQYCSVLPDPIYLCYPGHDDQPVLCVDVLALLKHKWCETGLNVGKQKPCYVSLSHFWEISLVFSTYCYLSQPGSQPCSKLFSFLLRAIDHLLLPQSLLPLCSSWLLLFLLRNYVLVRCLRDCLVVGVWILILTITLTGISQVTCWVTTFGNGEFVFIKTSKDSNIRFLLTSTPLAYIWSFNASDKIVLNELYAVSQSWLTMMC